MGEGKKYIEGVASLIREGFPDAEQAEDWVARQYQSLTPEEQQELDEWMYAERIAYDEAHNEAHLYNAKVEGGEE
jgi:hypothetical protein